MLSLRVFHGFLQQINTAVVLYLLLLISWLSHLVSFLLRKVRFRDFPVFWEVTLYCCMRNGLKDCSVRIFGIKLDPEALQILQNVANYLPSNAAPLSRRVKRSAALL